MLFDANEEFFQILVFKLFRFRVQHIAAVVPALSERRSTAVLTSNNIYTIFGAVKNIVKDQYYFPHMDLILHFCEASKVL